MAWTIIKHVIKSEEPTKVIVLALHTDRSGNKTMYNTTNKQRSGVLPNSFNWSDSAAVSAISAVLGVERWRYI